MPPNVEVETYLPCPHGELASLVRRFRAALKAALLPCENVAFFLPVPESYAAEDVSNRWALAWRAAWIALPWREGE